MEPTPVYVVNGIPNSSPKKRIYIVNGSRDSEGSKHVVVVNSMPDKPSNAERVYVVNGIPDPDPDERVYVENPYELPLEVRLDAGIAIDRIPCPRCGKHLRPRGLRFDCDFCRTSWKNIDLILYGGRR